MLHLVTEIYFVLLCCVCESVKRAESVMFLLFQLITRIITPYLHLSIHLETG